MAFVLLEHYKRVRFGYALGYVCSFRTFNHRGRGETQRSEIKSYAPLTLITLGVYW